MFLHVTAVLLFIVLQTIPQLSGLKQHLFVLLMNLQFWQSLVEISHLYSTWVGTTFLGMEELPDWG